jgi:hypothetical protein
MNAFSFRMVEVFMKHFLEEFYKVSVKKILSLINILIIV